MTAMSNYLFELDSDLVEEVHRNIKNTSVIRLFSAIDGYIRFSADIDTGMRTDGGLNEKVRLKSRGFYETILEEISQSVSRSMMTIRFFFVDLEMKVGQTDEPK